MGHSRIGNNRGFLVVGPPERPTGYLGVALRRLKEKEILLVTGCRSFEQLCAEKLDFSTTLANRLIHVVSTMTIDEAIGRL